MGKRRLVCHASAMVGAKIDIAIYIARLMHGILGAIPHV
jgi:hypothetical protein